jgi:hypothetical protein
MSASLPHPKHSAPADRLRGARGWRARVAGVIAVAALAPVIWTRAADSFAIGLALAAATTALFTAAALVWAARTPRGLAAALGLTVVGIAVTAGAIRADADTSHVSGERSSQRSTERYEYSYAERGARVTLAEARAVSKGASREAVEARLGTPAGEGTTVDSRLGSMDCLVYRGTDRVARFDERHAFCFRNDRYAAHRLW